MKMVRVLAVAVLLALYLALPALAAPQYHLTDLGDLPGGIDQSIGHGLNNNGQVVGESDYRAFIWSSGTGIQFLGTGNASQAGYSINDAGQVAGFDGRAVRWSADGTPVHPGSLPGGYTSSIAYGVNSSGQVVGYMVGASSTHAFLWSGTGVQDLGDLPGADDYSIAWAINDSGQVVGESEAFLTDYGSSFSHAFLWTSSGGMQDLGAIASTGISRARAINSAGQIVGQTTVHGGSHAFLWDPDVPNSLTGTMIDLGTLPGQFNSDGYAINNAGHIVGDSDFAGPFVWTASEGMRPLRSLLDTSGAGWTLSRAYAINDLDQIMGLGRSPSGVFHAYLLTPVPEPGTCVLAACGAAGLALLVRRRIARTRR